ncbi:hypothetical protein AAVH_39980, partial [Aphelenchoides avenae]
GTSVLAVSDTIIDVFQCLRRQVLDTLQIVSVHFNAIVEKKMALVCLRLLRSPSITRVAAERQFVLIVNVVARSGVGTRQTRLRTGVDDEAAAMT